MNSEGKIFNIKEFIKYLNKTVELLAPHIPNEEFEKRDSDVHKLFASLFSIYTVDKPTFSKGPEHHEHNKHEYQEHEPVDINDFLEKHIETRKNIEKKVIRKIDSGSKTRLDSDKSAMNVYNRCMRDAKSTGPVLYKKPDDTYSDIYTTDNNDSPAIFKNSHISTEEIDEKIANIRSFLLANTKN